MLKRTLSRWLQKQEKRTEDRVSCCGSKIGVGTERQARWWALHGSWEHRSSSWRGYHQCCSAGVLWRAGGSCCRSGRRSLRHAENQVSCGGGPLVASGKL
jgi:hypothetical protein